MPPFFTRLIHNALIRRHFWRHVDFPELAELYASRMLRAMGVSIVSIFVGVYLYQLGYSVLFIILYFACYFLWRAITSVPSAYVIARIGPKHASLVSNFLYIPSLIALILIPGYGIAMLALHGLFQGFSMSLYNVSYHVDFSKVKHSDHAGKEVGFMQIMDRIGTALSPLIGGVVAFMFGAQVTLVAAAVLFGLAALPLLLTPEPIRLHQHISFKGFKWRRAWRHMGAQAGLMADSAASNLIWPLFLILTIFVSGEDKVYAEIGAVTSVAIIAALIFAKIYGVLIDRARGGELLKISVIVKAGLHLVRPFIVSPVGVVGLNVANEAAGTGYFMSFMKGLLDEADRRSNHRIVYLSLVELASCVGAMLLFLITALLVWFFGDVRGLQLQYVVAAAATLLVLMHGFRVYAPKLFRQ